VGASSFAGKKVAAVVKEALVRELAGRGVCEIVRIGTADAANSGSLLTTEGAGESGSD
jgi:hypothetical protein